MCCLALVEWVLFELVRAPYRPPHDMLTFLGTEKYIVMALMLGLAVCGVAALSWWATRYIWTRWDAISAVVLIGVLLVLGTRVILYPSWPVTPWQLLLK